MFRQLRLTHVPVAVSPGVHEPPGGTQPQPNVSGHVPLENAQAPQPPNRSRQVKLHVPLTQLAVVVVVVLVLVVVVVVVVAGGWMHGTLAVSHEVEPL